MAYAKPVRAYGIETVADAVFTLERSKDAADREMASSPHAHRTQDVIDAGRRLARASIEAFDAARQAA